MAEYIDREAFLKDTEIRYCLPCQEAGKDCNGLYCRACWVDDMMKDVDDVPTADVAPVIRGCWTRYSTTMMSCSVCGRHTARHKFSYCPHCGAIMDGNV